MKTNFIFNLKLQLMTRLWGRKGAARECQCNKTGGQFTIDRLSVRYRQNISRIAALFLMLLTMSVGQVWGADVTEGYAIGFENGTTGVTADGTNSTSSESRTGGKALKTEYNGIGEKSPYLTQTYAVPKNSYLHAIAYTKLLSTDGTASSTSTQARLNAYFGGNGYGDAVNVTTSWQRLVVKRQYTSSGTKTGCQLKMARKHAAKGAILFDDIVYYISTSSSTDLTKPSSATGASATTSTILWENGTDAGTGVQKTLIFHRTGGTVGAEGLSLNDQGIYSLTATEGPSVVGNWTLIDANVAADATSKSGTFVAGEEYAIVHRDLAYNYSTPTYVTVAGGAPSKTWSLAGGFNSWSTTANVFSDNTTSVELAAGQTYEFKLNDGSGWFGNNGYMTCLYNQDWVFASGSDNCHISATQGGTYTFTLDASDENNPQLSVTYPDNPTIYLEPNSDWKRDGARFALYAFYKADGETKAEEWFDMTEDCGLYSANVPSKYPQIILCRMNPGQAVNKWSNKWNQTDDLNVPQDGNTQYTISGWDKSGSWGAPTTPKYTITFAGNGNTSGSMTNVSNINCGSNVTLAPNAFVKTGYTFSGWNDGSGNVADKATIENITSDITLTAQWTPVEYTITYNGLEGATNTDNPATYTIESTTINFVAPGTRTGYTFKSWDPASIAAGSTGNKAVTASWTAKKSTINFNKNGGTKGQSSTTATYGQAMPTSGWETPEKSGYTFGGYYDQDGGSGTQYYTATGTSARTWDKEDSSVTLYAKWTQDSPSGDCKAWGYGETNALPSNTSSEVSPVTIKTMSSLQSSRQLFVDGSAKSGSSYKLDGDSKYTEVSVSSGVISSINTSCSSGSNNTTIDYAIVWCSTATWDAEHIISAETKTGNANNQAQKINTSTAPSGAKSVRIYKGYTYNATNYGSSSSNYLYYVEVCTSGSSPSPTTYAVTYNNGGRGTAPANTTAAQVTLTQITGVDGWTNTGWKANVATTVDAAAVAANTLIANGKTVVLSAATTFTAQWEEDTPEPAGDCNEIGYGTSTTITLTASSGDLTLANSGASLAGSNMAPFSGATNMKPIQLGGATKYITGSLGGNEIESLKVSVSTANTSNRVFAVAFSSASSFDSENLVEVAAGATIRTFSANGTSETRTDFDIEAPAGAKSFAISRNFTSGTIKAGDPDYTNSGNRYLYYIKACAKEACTGSDAELAYGTTAVNKTVGDAAFKNTLTNPHSVAVTYTSTNTSVATVAADGTVTIVAAGSTTIKAASAEQTISSTTYCADEVSYTLTVAAAPEPTKYTVTVNDDGAGQHDCSKNLLAEEGQTVRIENTCEVTGYHLTGYTSSPAVSGTLTGTTYTFTMPAYNVTLTAQWEADGPTTYTVTYAAGTGASGTMTDSNSPYEEGDEVTVLENTFTAPTGKEFDSWEVRDASSNPITITDGKFTMPASNVTVTAQWRNKAAAGDSYMYFVSTADAATNGVTNTNIFTGAPKDGSGAVGSFTFNGKTYDVTRRTSSGKFTISFNMPVGWTNAELVLVYVRNGSNAFKLDGATDGEIVTAGDFVKNEFTISTSGTHTVSNASNVGLIFIGLRKLGGSEPVETYAITYDAGEGSGTMTADHEYAATTTVTIKDNAFTAPTGKEFAGWAGSYVEDEVTKALTITNNTFRMPAADVTLTAQWRNIAVTGVSLNKTATELTLGGATETLTATVTPDGAANKSVTWSSSNESIVTVADGVITAVAVGVATVTVTTVDGSKTATCEVTVKAAAIGGAEVCGTFENSGETVDGKAVHTLSSGLKLWSCDSKKKPTSSANVTQGSSVKSCSGNSSDFYYTKKYFVLHHESEDIVGLKIKLYNGSVRNIVSVMVGDEFTSTSSFENVTFSAPENTDKGCQELTVTFDVIEAGKYIYVELSSDAYTYEICYTPAGNKATKPVLPTLNNLTKNLGEDASWDATVTNAAAIATEGETVTYVWKDEDGTTLSTTAELTLNDVTMASAGKYTVTATVSGDGKTSSTASKTVTLTVNCSDVKPVITKTSAVDAIPVVLVAKKSSDNSDYASGDFRWERDGEIIADANTNTISISQSGTYTVTYINTCETTSDGFDVTITIPQPEATRLAPFQYVHINKVYDAKHQFVHLFHYVSTATGATKYVVTATIGGETIELPASAVVEDSEHAGDLLLDLNVMAQEDYNVGDEITLTLKPYDKTNVASTTVSATIQVKIIDDTPTLAFIVSGTNEASGTKNKNKHAKGGDFLTGVNVADLCLQTAMYKKAEGENPEVPGFDPSQELPLYTALKDNFIVTPVNGYAKFNKWNYEPFDLVFLTDFPKTDVDATALNNLAQLVDYRPMFSTKSYVSGLSQWQAVGFKEKPNDTKVPQLWMNITCESHTMFQHGGIDFNTIPREESNDEPVFTMLTGAGFDKSKALQGFDVSDADDFVHVAYTHYNATAGMEERGGHTYVSPTNVGSDDKKIIVSVERQREMDARLIMLVLNADATSKLTEQGMKVIVSALNYLLITDENEIVDCSLTFDNNKGSGNGKWNTASNWTDNRVPNADEKVRIIAPCVVDNKEAAAAEVKICTGSGHNGSLTITDGGALSVAGKVVRVENGHYFQTLPTSVGDIHIQSSVSGNGAFIHGDKAGQTKASVQMYSKAHYEEDSDGKKTKYWQYVGMPVAEADFNVDFYGAYTYVFDETKSTAWTRVRTGHGVPFVAYGVSQQAAKTYHLAGTLAGTANRTITLTKTTDGLDGMNLIGNSWTAPINIAAFETTDFENAKATVYIYNTGRDGESGNIGDASSTTAGQWISVAVEAAKGGEYVGLKVIPAMQAFQVNVEETALAGSITLDYDRLVRSTAAANINEPLRAPGRRVAAQDEVLMMRVRVADEKTHTDLYLMEHPMFSEAFDNGWDAGFVEGDGRSATLSAVSELGDMAFLAKESIDGTVLNFAPGRESLYTFSFGYHGDETYYLNDLQLQTSTRITPDATYSFVAAEGDLTHRFIISATPIANTPTDIGYQTDKVDKVQKVMMDGVLYIIKKGRIYDVLGETVK